ncbi:hypothetical protein ABEB36_003002 [Hypothenemus hampei]|uniref:RRM domain-containing protein n=1 Tax=Hypothenemus hampei TaxID=57062 RepID=A0ABD1F7P9_HYPHA
MDYQVGSLAELISGKEVLKKTKVVQQEFQPIKKEFKDSLPVKEKNPDSKQDIGKKIQHSKRKFKLETSLNQNGNYQAGKAKKRKFQHGTGNTTIKDEPVDSKRTELSRNEENAANRIKNKINQETKQSSEYKDRTVFVGNIPLTATKEAIKKHFRSYGPIHSIRIRGVPVANVKISKRIAALKKDFHPDRRSLLAYIRFVNASDAKKAEAENGKIFMNHHLRVQFCESDNKIDESKAIFVGNLSFKAEDEDLWNLFKTCGAVSHVRIVRDGRTGIGKGFGYVNFKDSDSVQLALEMEKVVLNDRELRITPCDSTRAKKLRKIKNPMDQKDTFNNDRTRNGVGKEKKHKNFKNVTFAGTKSTDRTKKKKFTKATLDKKKLAKKLVVVGSSKTSK